ncbi:hypothetical protein [Marinobacter sp. OP 3.4]|uniref:hypothetical protein n=1 Tax=Marinobacter sp. OP 3.4 TaxID=3076501 RepID=UPI002E22569E
MNLNNPEEFRREFEALDVTNVTNDPKAIREAFEKDQADEDERSLKQGKSA